MKRRSRMAGHSISYVDRMLSIKILDRINFKLHFFAIQNGIIIQLGQDLQAVFTSFQLILGTQIDWIKPAETWDYGDSRRCGDLQHDLASAIFDGRLNDGFNVSISAIVE